MIQGVITARHVLLQAPLIVHGFGIRTWLNCCFVLMCGRRTTFLELIWA